MFSSRCRDCCFCGILTKSVSLRTAIAAVGSQVSLVVAEFSDEAVGGVSTRQIAEHVQHATFNIESVHGDFGENSEAK